MRAVDRKQGIDKFWRMFWVSFQYHFPKTLDQEEITSHSSSTLYTLAEA